MPFLRLRRIGVQEASPLSTPLGWPSTRYTLLRRIRITDDRAAWTSFVDLYSPLVYRYCLRRGLQDADARDVVQEVFIRVGRGIERFEHDPARGQFRAWLGRSPSEKSSGSARS